MVGKYVMYYPFKCNRFKTVPSLFIKRILFKMYLSDMNTFLLLTIVLIINFGTIPGFDITPIHQIMGFLAQNSQLNCGTKLDLFKNLFTLLALSNYYYFFLTVFFTYFLYTKIIYTVTFISVCLLSIINYLFICLCSRGVYINIIPKGKIKQ